MTVRIKICGITHPEALAAAVDAGADAVGFVFAESPRQVDIDAALRLTEDLPAEIAVVAVMRHPRRGLAEDVLARLRPHFLQTDHEDFETLHLTGPTRPLPVYRSGRPLPARLPRLLLYEGPASGVGTLADWQVARELSLDRRLVLAGGLDPTNVVDAIRQVRPYAVDVSSGVESAPGAKDPDLIHQFISAVRESEAVLDRVGATTS